MTARAGLDDALASVPVYSIGSAAPYLPCTHVHTDDLRGSLSLLTAALSGQGRPARVRVPDEVTRTELKPPAFDGPGVRYRDAMAVLDAALPDGVDIVVDAGNIGASAIHHLPVRRDGRFIVALGMGGMGYSFGAGVGMAFGRRRRTVVIAGDGSFFMHGMEIHTALQYRLPVTFLLFDNHAHAMCVTREQLFYDGPLQLQPVWAKSAGCRAGDDVPGTAGDGRQPRSAACALRCVRHWKPMARRSSASNALPTKSRRSQTFSAPSPQNLPSTKENITMSLPALDDITAHRGTIEPIEDLIRIETSPREKATPIIMETMRSVYPHDEVFGEFCTVNSYVDCPPDELFDYMSDTRCLEEWTYSLRGFTPTEQPGLWLAYDRLGSETQIYTRTLPTGRP